MTHQPIVQLLQWQVRNIFDQVNLVLSRKHDKRANKRDKIVVFTVEDGSGKNDQRVMRGT